MYSVIIQNQKTMELFSQYQPLFADAINSGRIGVCKWIESGTTIDTALPELGNLTDDKEDWRAIIVRYIDDNCMASFDADPQNPYDFEINKEHSDPIEDSPIPLIRLTQMLGGIPPLEVQFKTEVIKEEHKAPRTVYAPIVDEAREKAYKELAKKYSYDGKMPSSIVIVSIRYKKNKDDNIGRAWLYHKESDSSEFWKRNHYPATCRFLVFDFENQGPIQKDADNFNFWLSLMLLSVNDFDSGVLQAYRLYTINTFVNRELMCESFQTLSDRLRDAKHSIEKSIKKDIEAHITEEEELPEYRLEVPVALKLPQSTERSVHQSSFPALSEGALSDIAIWNRQKKEVEEELAASVRSAERTLDQTADRMRDNCTFDEDEVDPLNKYQEEDLSRETNQIYEHIVSIQGTLPNEKVTDDENISKAADAVHKYLLGRVLRTPAIVSALIAILLLALAVIPAFVKSLQSSNKQLEIIGYVLLSEFAVVAIFAIVAILIQKLKLNTLIKRFNQLMKNAFNALVDNADNYSTYMSEIASHSRGSSYMNLSSRKKHYVDTEHSSKYKHIKAINILLGKLISWSKAYHLNVDFTSKRTDVKVDVDVSVAPSENKLYALEVGNSYDVEVNNSGMKVQSPFNFTERIEILREELYDDESN